MNTVILYGLVSNEPSAFQNEAGSRCLKFSVSTDNGVSSIDHRVIVNDEFLAQALFSAVKAGSFVHVSGELAYDGSGAFVSVPHSRGCDVRVFCGHASLQKVNLPADHTVSSVVSSPAKVEVKSVIAESDPVTSASEVSSSVEEKPVENHPVQAARHTPSSPGPVGGFNRRGMSKAPVINRPNPNVGKFNSISKPAEDPIPDGPAIDENVEGVQSSAPSENRNFSNQVNSYRGNNKLSSELAGASSLDDDIPF